MSVIVVHEPRKSGKALIFAWMVEVIAVSMGLTLAVFAGIEGSDGGPATIAVAILPFAALSVIELTKIPLVGLAFEVKSWIWRLIAIIALLLVTAATFENFVFGFERGFNERIRAVETAEQSVITQQRAAVIADMKLPQLTARQTEIDKRLALLRDEVAAIRQQSRDDITDAHSDTASTTLANERARIEQTLREIDARESGEVQTELARCRRTETPCRISAIRAVYRQQRDALSRRSAALLDEQNRHESETSNEVASARSRRNADIAQRDVEREALETELASIREQLVAAQTTSLRSSETVASAERERDIRIERSQLHRLASVLFGNHEPETVEKTKKLFVVSLAAIVAMIGSLIAAMHFAAQDARDARRRPLSTALRLYLARRRRRLPILHDIGEQLRQRHGISRNLRGWLARRRRAHVPVITRTMIKEVEVPIERLKLIFLPLNASEEQIAAIRAEHGAIETA